MTAGDARRPRDQDRAGVATEPGPLGGYGLDLPPGLTPPRERRGGALDPLALASLGLGLGSIAVGWCCFGIGPLLALGGIGTGVVALIRGGKPPLEYTGRGLAMVGIASGSLTVLATIAWAVWVYMAMR